MYLNMNQGGSVKVDILSGCILSVNLTGKPGFPVVSFGIRDSKDSWNTVSAIQRNFVKFLERRGLSPELR